MENGNGNRTNSSLMEVQEVQTMMSPRRVSNCPAFDTAVLFVARHVTARPIAHLNCTMQREAKRTASNAAKMIPMLLCVVVFSLSVSVSDALLGGARRLVRSPHRSATRQWASAADGAASEDSDGKRKKKNDTDDVDDEMRKKLPRAMIKPSNDDDNSTPSGPPQNFDSGISGRNSKASAASQQRALLADLNAAARAAAGDKAASIERNWKYGLCRHHVVFKATEVVKRIRFKGDATLPSLRSHNRYILFCLPARISTRHTAFCIPR